jgi:hypothetical protein
MAIFCDCQIFWLTHNYAPFSYHWSRRSLCAVRTEYRRFEIHLLQVVDLGKFVSKFPWDEFSQGRIFTWRILREEFSGDEFSADEFPRASPDILHMGWVRLGIRRPTRKISRKFEKTKKSRTLLYLYRTGLIIGYVFLSLHDCQVSKVKMWHLYLWRGRSRS